MATITNKSNQCISVTGREYSKIAFPRLDHNDAIDPRSTLEGVPEDVARDWAKRAKFLVDGGFVEVAYDEPEAKAPAKTDAPAPVKGEHYTKTIQRIASITDPNELESMHANEERPSVTQALEDRMAELNA